MVEEKPSIWKRCGILDRDRRERMRELMEEYDKTVYYPQMLALQKECEETTGHTFGRHHDNGLGWHWNYCNQCGGRYDIEQHTKYGGDDND